MVIVLGLAALYALKGCKAGLIKSAIKLAVVVGSAFMCAGLSVLTVQLFRNSISRKIEQMSILDGLRESIGDYAAVVNVVVRMLASAILFVPILIGVLLIARFVLSAIYKKGGNTETDQVIQYESEEASFFERHDKLFGALVGAFSGIFIAIAVLSPVTGALRTTSEVISIVRDVVGDEKVDEMEAISTVEYFANDFGVAVADACGGGVLFDISTSVSCEGEMTRLSSEIKAIKNMDIQGTVDSLKSIGKFDEASLQSIDSLIDVVERAPLIKLVAATAVKGMADSWLSGESYMGIERPVLADNKAIDSFFDEVLKVLTTTDSQTVIKDVETFLAIGRIVADYSDSISTGDYSELIEAFVGGDITDRIRNEIILNPHMRPIEQAIDDIIMQVAADEINDFTKYTFENREELFTQIADVLTSTSDINASTRKDLVTEEINNAMIEYGVYSSEATAEKIADILINGISGKDGYVSVDDVRSYFDKMTGSSDAE